MSRPRKHPLPTYSQVAFNLRYDPETGDFERRTVRGFRPIPVTVQNYGYRLISLSAPIKTMLLAHRLAWLLHYGEWPDGEIDHRDGDKLNNRIDNLRPADRAENMTNRATYNSYGFKGVTMRPDGRYMASISKNKIRHHLGSFDTAEEAGAAYNEAAKRLHAEFANPLVIIRGEIKADIKFI